MFRWIKGKFLLLGYQRLLSCSLLGLAFSLVFSGICLFLSVSNIGFSIEALQGNENVSFSPVTLISLGATTVSISLTLLGFAMNTFSKIKFNKGDANTEQNYSTSSKAIEILCLRYRGFWRSLCFLAFWELPTLSKAFSLLSLLFGMCLQCYIGYNRVFYLSLFVMMMIALDASLLFDVFSLFADQNYVLEKTIGIINKKIIKKMDFLINPKSTIVNPDYSTLRQFSRQSIVSGVEYLVHARCSIEYWRNEKRFKKSMLFNNCELPFEYLLTFIGCLNNQPNYKIDPPKKETKTEVEAFANLFNMEKISIKYLEEADTAIMSDKIENKQLLATKEETHKYLTEIMKECAILRKEGGN